MTKRRYGDDEVSEILSLATADDARERALPVESGGMTLDELQRIGEEAGIERARIAEAAAALDARGTASPVKRMLGMPIGVSRVVDLPRAPTDREWEQLISEFRTTFGAHGQATTSGGLRDWSVGNLHISVEPTVRGHQLRLTTRNELALVLNTVGLGMGAFSLLMGAIVAGTGQPKKALVLLGIFGGLALSAFVANVIRLPGWARERARQMELTAERVVKLLSNP